MGLQSYIRSKRKRPLTNGGQRGERGDAQPHLSTGYNCTSGIVHPSPGTAPGQFPSFVGSGSAAAPGSCRSNESRGSKDSKDNLEEKQDGEDGH